jgi:hypothetical protein
VEAADGQQVEQAALLERVQGRRGDLVHLGELCRRPKRCGTGVELGMQGVGNTPANPLLDPFRTRYPPGSHVHGITRPGESTIQTRGGSPFEFVESAGDGRRFGWSESGRSLQGVSGTPALEPDRGTDPARIGRRQDPARAAIHGDPVHHEHSRIAVHQRTVREGRPSQRQDLLQDQPEKDGGPGRPSSRPPQGREQDESRGQLPHRPRQGEEEPSRKDPDAQPKAPQRLELSSQGRWMEHGTVRMKGGLVCPEK